MADERKAGALILSNLGMFNEAAILFENVVEPTILEAIDFSVKAFTKENDNWEGEFGLADEDNDCWLAPAAWNTAESKDDDCYKAWFDIDLINDDGDYWTALFCKQGSEGGEAGFMFNVDPRSFGGKNSWNSYIKNIDSNMVTKLEKSGFKHQGKGKFFLPVHLDVNEIKAAWEKYGDENTENFAEDCLEPLSLALQTIQDNLVIFDEIMNGYSSNSLK